MRSSSSVRSSIGRRSRSVEEYLAGARRAHAHQLQAAHLDRGLVARREHERQAARALRALGRVGAAQHQDPVRVVGERRVELLAADHPLAVLERGAGREREHVGASARLAHAEAHQELAPREPRQELGLLRAGRGLAQHAGGHRHQQPVGGERRKAPRQLFAQDRARQHVRAAAAELGRDRESHPAELGEAAPERARDAPRAIELADAFLGQLAVEERPDALAQQLVLVDPVEVHAATPRSPGDSPR
jgi:hypothetical protein